MMKPLVLALALAAAATAQAQTTAAPATGASAPLPSSPAKKALVARILQLEQPGVDLLARQLTEQPAVQLLQAAGPALQRLPAERREPVGRELQADARKYVDDTLPIVRAAAVRLAPGTVGTMLDERLTEAELKQIVATLESPAYRKFQLMAAEMQRTLGAKLVAETKGSVEPHVSALQQTMARRLQPPAAPAAPASAAKP